MPDRFYRMEREAREISDQTKRAMTRLVNISSPKYANKYYKKIRTEAYRQRGVNSEYIIRHLNKKASELEILKLGGL